MRFILIFQVLSFYAFELSASQEILITNIDNTPQGFKYTLFVRDGEVEPMFNLLDHNGFASLKFLYLETMEHAEAVLLHKGDLADFWKKNYAHKAVKSWGKIRSCLSLIMAQMRTELGSRGITSKYTAKDRTLSFDRIGKIETRIRSFRAMTYQEFVDLIGRFLYEENDYNTYTITEFADDGSFMTRENAYLSSQDSDSTANKVGAALGSRPLLYPPQQAIESGVFAISLNIAQLQMALEDWDKKYNVANRNLSGKKSKWIKGKVKTGKYK